MRCGIAEVAFRGNSGRRGLLGLNLGRFQVGSYRYRSLIDKL